VTNNKSYNEKEELEKLHTIEDEGVGNVRSTYGDDLFDPSNLTDTAMHYLTQIKELQEQLEAESIKLQRIEMAILGYSQSLQDELKGGN
jgi:hypothetical protein